MKYSFLYGAFCHAGDFLFSHGKEKMRACFLGQNICALGFGVATLQSPPLLLDEQTGKPLAANDQHVTQAGDKSDAPQTAAPWAGSVPL
jgi:hypothetical protein